MSGFSDMGFIYDWRSTATTPTATCASGEVSRSPSHYRGEQYDPDLGLYYLRARYYNPGTGRFLSRDPEDGQFWDPKTLHKYLYTGGDPVNRVDPRGRELFEVELEDTWIEKSEEIGLKVTVVSICTAYSLIALDVLGFDDGFGKDFGAGVGGYVCSLLLGG
jgi:RHS repeat-associated protein